MFYHFWQFIYLERRLINSYKMQHIHFCFIFTEALQQQWKDDLDSSESFYNSCQLDQIIFWAVRKRSLTVHLIPRQLIKAIQRKSFLFINLFLFFIQERRRRNLVCSRTSIFLSYYGLKDIHFMYKFYLDEWLPPRISLCLRHHFLKWKTKSLTLSHSLTWGYVNTAFIS